MRFVSLLLLACGLLAPDVSRAQTADAILDSVQLGAFHYFWDEANPANGMIRDRSQSGSPASIAAVGFGLSAICIGSDHGWITRTQASGRVLTTLQTFWNGPQGNGVNGNIGYKGFFYHFLGMTTATRFTTWANVELSTIDSALLLAGVLDAKQYFDGSAGDEPQIRALADSIYRRMDWSFMRNFNPGILMGWKPEGNFNGYGQWIGYNEAMILYILALGSPHAPQVPTTVWNAWTGGYNWNTWYGQTFVVFPPLFGHQYSHSWIDFRNIKDAYMQAKGIDYFENSRRATLAQRAYCVANPSGWVGYSDSLWGITAGDGPPPIGYRARGAPPAQNDDGTITPSATIASLPFAPEASLPAIQYLYRWFKSSLWGPYGFRDGMNLSVAWFGPDAVGIDQGPIIIAIENYRTGRVWTRFMRNPEVILGLQRAGFTGPPLAVPEPAPSADLRLEMTRPNPFHDHATLRYVLPRAGRVRVTVLDVAGRVVDRLVDADLPAGTHEISLNGLRLASGVYRCRLELDGRVVERTVVRIG